MDETLSSWFKEKESVLVAFSGGVDSSVLAALAHNALSERAVAVTLRTECSPKREIQEAERVAHEIGIKHKIIDFSQFAVFGFKENPKERCYICKKAMSKFLKLRGDELGLAAVCDGVTLSDLDEYRPGIKAADEERILHPFLENGLRKNDIRALARELGLSNADAPSSACLASRFPEDFEISEAVIKRVDNGEEYLKSMGLNQVRVRVLDADCIRIEADDTERLLKLDLSTLKRKFNEIGFDNVHIDPNGYRPGGGSDFKKAMV